MINVGFIGAGANTKNAHIPKLLDQKGVVAFGVANRTYKSGEIVAKEFGIENVYNSWEELLDEDSIDAVCIGTWPNMHSTLTLRSLEMNKHVLCEARMATNSLEAEQMFEASKNYPNLITQIVPAPHTLPYDNTIKNWIKNEMGDLILFDVKCATGEFPDYSKPIHWREDRDISGNNIMHMGIFYEGGMRWLGTASSVSAHSNVLIKKRVDGSTGEEKEISIPDHLEAIGEMSCGGSYHMTHSTVLGGSPLVDIYIYGTEGTLHIFDDNEVKTKQAFNSSKLRLESIKPNQNKWKVLSPKKSEVGGWRVEEEFISAIKGKEKITHTSFSDGLKYMQFTDALRMSWESGNKINLPLN
jgi:predicted dehydrogenase